MGILNDFIEDFMSHLTVFIIGAFSFVVALAWNDTIKLFFNEVTSNNGTVVSSFIYTLLVTSIALIIIFFLEKYKKLIKHKLSNTNDKLDKRKFIKKLNYKQSQVRDE